ncbi:glycosyltransferase [Candidatus Pacearchaeota archaeon]|nr:glycosyltransferase [Candidatus Pacearchaeota archaeon]
MEQKISVIMPFYNDEDIAGRVVDEVNRFIIENPRFEFILVNDGSKDNTLNILKEKTKKLKNKNLYLLSYEKNMGKGHAIRTGVNFAKTDYICFLDSDLAYSLDHLFILENALKKDDVVMGCRGLGENNFEKTKLIRVLFGKAFNLFSRIILNLNFVDMQAGIKGFRKKIAKQLFGAQKINGFAFDVEIIFLAKKKKARIKEIAASLSESHINQSSKVNIIKDSSKMFFSLLKIKWYDLTGKYG